ncbi:MAG: hypothetical protein ACRBBN_19660, partial [Methyloligellaceae bacterium]
MFNSMKKFTSKSVIQLFVIISAIAAINSGAIAGPSPFNTMLGSWGGSGIFELKSGKKERIQCTAYYTGGSSQLNMNIRCKGNQQIEMRSKMSLADGKITGTWLETTFNAEGNISGKALGRKIALAIKGAVSGTMEVSYSRVRQEVTIHTT